MKKYLPRIADKILSDKLEAKGAVLVKGAKWCGKTTTALQIAKSCLFMQDPENKSQNLALAELDPKLLLQGETPRLIDEWQLAPNLWDAIRFEVDRRGEFNQFILTGSSLPFKDTTSHSGTGRIAHFTMRPLSTWESEDSNGKVSIKSLFNNAANVSSKSILSIQDVSFLICRGGWPIAVNQTEKIALAQAYDYVDSILASDVSASDGIRKDPQRVARLFRSYARFISSDAKATNIQEDMLANEVDTLSLPTLYSYINALKSIFVIEDLPAWNPNLRSKTAVRTSDTRHFVDPSIAVAALGLGPDDLINDLNTMGLLYESMVVRDLRVYAEALDGKVYKFRQKDGLECDAVLHLRNGSYGLIEAKLGGSEIERAAQNLTTLKNRIDTTRMKAPSFLMVVTGTGYAYTREDGVHVVPVGCLKP
jgi:hypothetical protein